MVVTHGDTFPNCEHFQEAHARCVQTTALAQLVLARMRLLAILTTGTQPEEQLSHTLTKHINFRCTIPSTQNFLNKPWCHPVRNHPCLCGRPSPMSLH